MRKFSEDNMTVAKLNFYWANTDVAMNVDTVDDRIRVVIKHGIDGSVEYRLDRNQADLLRLYLTEHLRK